MAKKITVISFLKKKMGDKAKGECLMNAEEIKKTLQDSVKGNVNISDKQAIEDIDLEKLIEEGKQANVWNPAENEIIAGTIIVVSDFPDRYQGSILLTIEQAHNKGKISWWLTTVAKYKIADMSDYVYQKTNFESLVVAIKLTIGKGIVVRYDGKVEGANYNYKNFTVVRAPQFDRKKPYDTVKKDEWV